MTEWLKGDPVETWERHPKRDEYRAANGGFGMCNTSSGHRVNGRLGGHCIFGGIGCNVDHRFIRLLNAAEGREVKDFPT